MPFPKPWTDPAHVGDFLNFLPFGLSSSGRTMHGRRRGGIPRTQGGRAADCNSRACNKTEEKRKARGGKKKKKKQTLPAPDPRQAEVVASPLPPIALRGVEGEPPGKQLQLIHTPVCTALRSPQGGRSGAPGPASASCSWGAVTSQIPASLCLPSCSDSAGVYSALAGPAPALAAARRAGGRRLRAALGGGDGGGDGGGASSPRAEPAPSGASQAPARSPPTAAFEIGRAHV